MKPTTKIKIIAAFFLLAELSVWPAVSNAQLANPVTTAVSAVPVSAGGTIGTNGAFNTQMTPIIADKTLCEAKEKAFELTDDATKQGLKFGSIIGGDGTYAFALNAEKTSYTTYKLCLEAVLASLNKVVAAEVYTSTIKQQMITQVNGTIQTYRTRLEALDGKIAVATENVWKALLINILMNTTKVVADQLVNKLVNSYKIANAKKYVDSVATLAYDNQFIRDNFPDNQGQLMARAIMQDPNLRTHIQPGIYAMANNALNYNGNSYTPSSVQYSDPDFYAKMALAGTAQANPYFQQMNYVANLDAAHSNAVQAAQRQIAQGSGYKAPVNCAGTLQQQAQIDSQTKAASDLMKNRDELYNNLFNAQKANIAVNPADLAKAKADSDAAHAAWEKLPFTVVGANSVTGTGTAISNLTSGANSEGAAAIVMCEAISSPAVLVNQGIDSIFKGLNIGQYNSNNLPGSLTAISSMATQLGSSLILGGITGSPAYKINETQVTGQAVGLAAGVAAQILNDNAQNNLASGVNLTISRNTNADNANGKGYTIAWDIVTAQLPTAKSVKVTGPGITDSLPLLLSGDRVVVAPSDGTYVVTVYNAAGAVLVTASQAIYSSKTTLNKNSNSAQVAGAYTEQPSYTIRGSLPGMGLRGLAN